MSDPFQLNKLVDAMVQRAVQGERGRFGDGVVAVAEGSYASVRKGDPEAPATPGFYAPPDLAVVAGDHVWYFDGGGFKLILKVLNRSALKPSSGVWTPGFVFQTPGNHVIVYSEQVGVWRRIGDVVLWSMRLTSSTFTHTTASGNARLTGLPFTVAVLDAEAMCLMSGWTKANYTQVALVTRDATKEMEFRATGSGQALATLGTGDFPTGGTLQVRASGFYLTSDD